MTERQCKWCGSKVRGRYICKNCAIRLKLIRQMLSMVKEGVKQ